VTGTTNSCLSEQRRSGGERGKGMNETYLGYAGNTGGLGLANTNIQTQQQQAQRQYYTTVAVEPYWLEPADKEPPKSTRENKNLLLLEEVEL
jgi:hypothetical protein